MELTMIPNDNHGVAHTCEHHAHGPRGEVHTHTCPNGHRWGHGEASMNCEACHTCPECGHRPVWDRDIPGTTIAQARAINDLRELIFGRE